MHQGHNHCWVFQYIDIFVTWGSHDLRLSVATSALALRLQSSQQVSDLQSHTHQLKKNQLKKMNQKNLFFEGFFRKVIFGRKCSYDFCRLSTCTSWNQTRTQPQRGAVLLAGWEEIKKSRQPAETWSCVMSRRDDSPPHAPANLVTGRGL